jgi:hypothetical protein
VGKDGVGEKVSGDFDELGLGNGSAEIIIGQINGHEEGVTRHERV